MELLSITIAAGETKRFERAGRYIEIFDASGLVDLYLSDANGGRVDYAKGAQSGIFLEASFAAFELASATAQTVLLLVAEGRGGSRRQPGIVRVVDEITDAIVSTPITPATAVAAIAYTQIVAPASNVRGIVLRFCSVSAQANAAGQAIMQLAACKSAPTGYNTPTQRYTIAGAASSNGAAAIENWRGNKLLPAGWGLYYGTEVITNPAQLLSARVEYEVM